MSGPHGPGPVHAGRLAIDDAELAACVGCGLCLPHCPTYRVSGEEVASPRGRIAAMRLVHLGGAPIDDDFVAAMDACVQCRGCETACPSGVRYGHLMEGTRETLAAEHRLTPWWQRAGLRALPHHRLVLAGSTALAVGQRLGLVPRRLGLPPLPLRRPGLVPSGDDVWLFTGCVMDAWMRPTHLAAQRLVEATGAGVAFPGPGGACCGALHLHAGLVDDARRRAERVMASMPGDAPVLVDAAGCGAALRDYGHLLGTAAARAFGERVLDVHEWLAPRVGALPRPARPVPGRVAVQDPCHLRHVQRAHQHVRTVLAPYVEELVELGDDGLCCGAGGAYAALHPDTAGEIRARKLAAIAASGAGTVASANPGCALHLGGAGVRVRHPLDLVAEALGPALTRR
ncbi:MAG: (Fe-S)-binding protein [Acidimicrobiales bacterium]|nr:(Fe-S)-binding protein [Acidimicrobiales bacterium]